MQEVCTYTLAVCGSRSGCGSTSCGSDNESGVLHLDIKEKRARKEWHASGVKEGEEEE